MQLLPQIQHILCHTHQNISETRRTHKTNYYKFMKAVMGTKGGHRQILWYGENFFQRAR